MTTLTPHTPTPWTVANGTEITAFDGPEVEAVLLGTFSSKWLSPERNKANVRHLVKCTNEREGLLATLDMLCAVLERPTNRMGKPEITAAVSDLVRPLALQFEVGPCETLAEQASKVGRTILSLARAREE